MSQAAGCFSGLVSRLSRSRGAVPRATRDRCAQHEGTPPRGVADPRAFNTLAAIDSMRFACVGTNEERIAQMLERYQDALHLGRPMPDGAFVEQVIRPLVTWLKALTYLPDEGELADIGTCARELLGHVVVPESRSRHTLQRFGSTEQLDRDDAPMDIARGFVTWTIPLLHRLTALLKCLARGEASLDTFQKLLLAIRRQAGPETPAASEGESPEPGAASSAGSSDELSRGSSARLSTGSSAELSTGSSAGSSIDLSTDSSVGSSVGSSAGSLSSSDEPDEPIYATVLPRSERLRQASCAVQALSIVEADVSPIPHAGESDSHILESTRL